MLTYPPTQLPDSRGIVKPRKPAPAAPTGTQTPPGQGLPPQAGQPLPPAPGTGLPPTGILPPGVSFPNAGAHFPPGQFPGAGATPPPSGGVPPAGVSPYGWAMGGKFPNRAKRQLARQQATAIEE